MKPRVAVLHNRPDPNEPSDTGVLGEADDVDAALGAAGYATEKISVERDNLLPVLADLAGRRADTVVFNLCEGLEGSSRFEPTVAGLLELHAIRFTGNPSLTLAHALDKGVAGARYWLMGRPEDEISTAAGCNRACEIAGVEHRVADLDHRTAPREIVETFGPTLYAIAEAAANEVRPPRTSDNPTHDQLGYDPMSLDDGLRLLISWLRGLGRL